MNRVIGSYVLVVLIWGSTWFAIQFQLTISPILSVFYRFFFATLICFALAFFQKQRMSFSGRQHLWMGLQGICLFSLNFILFYSAGKYIPSGLVAATYTLVIYFNMLGVRLFFQQPFSLKVFAGSILGGLGLLLLFSDSILNFQTDANGVKGLLLGTLATGFASSGNLLSVRNSKDKIPLLSGISWSMAYGTLFTLILILLFGTPFAFDFSPGYLGSLAYLSIFGTVVGFICYLSLIANLGADKAAYTSILTPMVALILSALFEKFDWQISTWIGITFCLLGNYLALRWRSAKSSS